MSLNALYKDAKTGLTYGLADVVPSFNGTIGSANFAVSNPDERVERHDRCHQGAGDKQQAGGCPDRVDHHAERRPSSLKLTTNTDIIRSIQFSTVAQAGAATTAAQATTVPTGFSLQILPRIVGSSDISLIASVENSAIASETQQSVGQGSLDRPADHHRAQFLDQCHRRFRRADCLAGLRPVHRQPNPERVGWFNNPFDGEQKAGLVSTRLLLILRAVILKGPPAQAVDRPSATADLFDNHGFQGE